MILSGCSNALDSSALTIRSGWFQVYLKGQWLGLRDCKKDYVVVQLPSNIWVECMNNTLHSSHQGTSYRGQCSLSQHLVTSDIIQKWVFKADIARMLHYNKVLLAALLSLTIVLWNASETSNLRLVSAEKSKAFEHPLKIMLMLLRILVEISKQYGSK